LPNLTAFLQTLSEIFLTIINLDFKRLIISLSYIYYFTVFFLMLRILIYCGVTLVGLINTKHTTFLKKNSTRTQLAVFLKFNNTHSLKQNFLKLVTVNCL
jgi:hypothetical protein